MRAQTRHRRRAEGSADRLTDALDAGRDEERRRAVRALLRHPLLTAALPDPAAFALVRRHAAWLQQWFNREAGWSLRVDGAVARLSKVVADPHDPSRPVVSGVGQRAPFSRRRYVLTCLALAVLERSDGQVTLGRLVERVVVLAADPALEEAGITFRLEGRDERTDLAGVARLLLSLGVLTRVAGDEQAFVSATGDVLYDVDRRVLATLLSARRGPSLLAGQAGQAGQGGQAGHGGQAGQGGQAGHGWSADPATATAERIAAVLAEPRPDTDDQRNLAIRHGLARRLLDDPVLYDADLTVEERAYLRSQRPFLLRRLTEGSGLVAEARAEGIALVDPTGEATDLGMPEEGTDGHVTLLLAEFLAGRLAQAPDGGRRDEAGEEGHVIVPLGELEAHVRALAPVYRSHWRREAGEPGAERELVRAATARLAGLGLLRRHDGCVEPLPALARFSFAAARLDEPETLLDPQTVLEGERPA